MSHAIRLLRSFSGALALLLLAAPALSAAQAGEPAARPPQLIESPDPTYPPEALAARREGRVVLLLTIGADGTVLEAEILESPGFGLGEAARDAVRGARFEPALREGTPVAARIRFIHDFVLPAGAIEGTIRLPGASGLPAVGVEVGLLDEAANARTTRTDAEGRFRFDDLRPGRYRLLAGSAAIGAAEAEVTVEPAHTVAPALLLAPPDDPPALEVTVEGESEAEKLRGSAQAVHVVETEDDHRRTADLGEVLARTHGVSVRRDGGLGSEGRFALNGFDGDQVRFFLDGIPLHLAGYPFGIANVPVNVVSRIEVYRGVVPMRFGADALGGAVNLVTDDVTAGTRGSASYQVGSFNTHRATAGASHLDDGSGLFLGVAGFFDHSDNDYTVRDAPMFDERGRIWTEDAERFHDAYRAAGGNVQAGWVDRAWARRLLLRAFVTDYTKELQHDALGYNAYGEVEYGGLTAGTSIRYEHELLDGVTVDLVGGFAWTEFWLRDLAECKYSWTNRCVAPRPAELGDVPRDDLRWDRTTFARLNLAWEVAPSHVLRFTTAPTLFERSGDNREVRDESDELRRELTTDTLVSGIEYEVDLFDDRLENVFFVKDYRQRLSASGKRIGADVERTDRITGTGVGNALRYRIAPKLFAKASWEWATRMPSPDELFGDGVLTDESLELRPETSQNLNLGLTLDGRRTKAGTFRGDLNLFLRDARDLIALTFNNNRRRHENVSEARAVGVEAAAGWEMPGGYLAVDGNLTWLDFRNTTTEGAFGPFEGDRIPNQPWLFANAALRLRLDRFASIEDRVELVWNTRFVGKYFRGWESVGDPDSKEFVPDQLVHTTAITWGTEASFGSLALTGEVQNVGDAIVFDNLGTQRPGRSWFLKTTAAF